MSEQEDQTDREAQSLTVEVQRYPMRNVVVEVTGDLANGATSALRQVFEDELTGSADRLVVDLSRVSAINSDGVDALAMAAGLAGESDISLSLVTIRGGHIEAALEAADLTELFDVFGSVSDAMGGSH